MNQQYLKECLYYNPAFGIMVWLERPLHHFKNARSQKAFNNKMFRKVAGTLTESHGIKYFQISINSKIYKLHRIIRLYLTGKLPRNQIDHENGNGLDNRPFNLRDATNEENSKNTKLFINNTTGVIGVSPHAGKFIAQIRVNKKTKHLGTFDTVEKAAKARKDAELKYGYHRNHGRGSNFAL